MGWKNKTTDEWRGYRPICKNYDIEQVLSQNGMNFKALHVILHQVKSWIRTTCFWVSERHINRCFDEFCFKINRSQRKETIFNNLIKRMVVSQKIHQAQITGN